MRKQVGQQSIFFVIPGVMTFNASPIKGSDFFQLNGRARQLKHGFCHCRAISLFNDAATSPVHDKFRNPTVPGCTE